MSLHHAIRRRPQGALTGVLGVVIALVISACSGTAAPTGAPTTGAPASGTAAAGDVPSGADPQLAAIYRDFVQKEMPGVPFSVLEGAKREAKVVWYRLRLTDAGKSLTAAFKTTFPFMEVEEFENTGAPTLERFLTEKRAGQNRVDVAQFGNVTHYRAAAAEGFIETYKVTSESALKPGSFESGQWYPSTLTGYVYMYNTNLVTEEQANKLVTYDGLWDPALRAIPKAIQNAIASSASQEFFYYIDKTFGRDSWLKLKAANAKIYEPLPAIDAVARGEAGITYTGESLALAQYNNKAPVRWRVPEPGITTPYPSVIAKNPPHPNAARLLQEFIMSKTGQIAYNTYAESSARTDVGELRSVKTEPWFKKAEDRKLAPPLGEEFQKALPKLLEDYRAVFLQ